MTETTPDRRTAIADAAISVLATGGMRGFTHRAVDRTAGLPEGSTSYYFRTRIALLHATLARMAELDTADIGELPDLTGPVAREALTELMTSIATHWLTDARERTLARFELTLEATRRPDLRAEMSQFGAGFRLLAVRILEDMGVAEARRRGLALVASFDGLVLHQIADVGAGTLDTAELRASFRELLDTALC
jgi:DNA-binding transcriptional regulator YbjK